MSERNLDRYGRWRNVTVAFRASPEEAALIDAKVAASGLSKQSYIIDRLLGWEVKVIPSSRIQRALSEQMNRIYRELRRIRDGSDIGPELEEVIVLLAHEFHELGTIDKPSDVECEDMLVKTLK